MADVSSWSVSEHEPVHNGNDVPAFQDAHDGPTPHMKAALADATNPSTTVGDKSAKQSYQDLNENILKSGQVADDEFLAIGTQDKDAAAVYNSALQVDVEPQEEPEVQDQGTRDVSDGGSAESVLPDADSEGDRIVGQGVYNSALEVDVEPEHEPEADGHDEEASDVNSPMASVLQMELFEETEDEVEPEHELESGGHRLEGSDVESPLASVLQMELFDETEDEVESDPALDYEVASITVDAIALDDKESRLRKRDELDEEIAQRERDLVTVESRIEQIEDEVSVAMLTLGRFRTLGLKYGLYLEPKNLQGQAALLQKLCESHDELTKVRHASYEKDEVIRLLEDKLNSKTEKDTVEKAVSCETCTDEEELLKVELEDKENELVEAYDEIHALRREAERATRAWNRLERLRTSHEPSLDRELPGGLDPLNLNRDDLVERVKKLERMLENERNLSRAKDSEIARLDREVDRYQVEVEAHDEELMELVSKLGTNDMRSPTGRGPFDHVNDLPGRLEQAETRRQRARDIERDLARLKTDAEFKSRQIQELQEERDELHVRIETVGKLLDEETQLASARSIEIYELRDELEDRDRAIAQMKATIARGRHFAATNQPDQDDDIFSPSERVAQILEANEEDKLPMAMACIEQLEDELVKSCQAFDKFSEVESAIAQVEKERDDTLARLLDSESERHNLVERLRDLERALNRKEREITGKEGDADELKEEIADLLERLGMQDLELERMRGDLLAEKMWFMAHEDTEDAEGRLAIQAPRDLYSGHSSPADVHTDMPIVDGDDSDQTTRSQALDASRISESSNQLYKEHKLIADLRWTSASLLSARAMKRELEQRMEELLKKTKMKDLMLQDALERIQELEDQVCYCEDRIRRNEHNPDHETDLEGDVEPSDETERLKAQLKKIESQRTALQVAFVEKQAENEILRRDMLNCETELSKLNDMVVEMESRAINLQYEKGKADGRMKRKMERVQEIRTRLTEFLDTVEQEEEEDTAGMEPSGDLAQDILE